MDDLSAIERLHRRYADVATRQAWPEFAEVVAPEASIRFDFVGVDDTFEVQGPEGLADLGRAAMRNFAFYVYVPLNSIAELIDPTTATGRAYALETARDHDGRWLDIYGQYDDRYERRSGDWLISRRSYRELDRRMRETGTN